MERQAAETLDTLWETAEPAASEARFRAHLAALTEPSPRAQTLTQLARAVGLQRRFEEAHAILDEAAALLDPAESLAAGALARIRHLLERGRVHNSAGEKASARENFQQAWEAARAAAEDGYAVDAEAVDTAHMLAIAAETREAALRWNERALELAEDSEDERARRWQASLLNNLGWARHDGGEYEAALALFERALTERQKSGQNRETRIARWCVARCLRSLGRLEEALAQQRGLLAEEEALGEIPGFTWEEIGECLLALGRGAAARPYFAQAYAVLSEDAWLAAEEEERLARLRRLGES